MSYKRYMVAPPGRMKWIKGQKPEGCIFCQMFKGEYKDAKILHKSSDVAVIMNIYPYSVGHLQVIPIRHVTVIEGLTDKEGLELLTFVKKSVRLLKAAIRPEGFNIGINIGEVSGASIEHLHVHVVPRFHDAGFIETTASTKVLPESIDTTFKRLKKFAHMLAK
ncbi:MAG: HIT domain-containing protein [Candidatus Aenigmarchaeota archaeon]|nr:HIT domain-containing protein [Candidatus Aenigmarchaeota archaeon]